jgi:2-desacetyl-2-hydroxyethyl bacteriochlorophyllide A dehydrogenase
VSLTTLPEQARRIIFPACGEVCLQEYQLAPLTTDHVRVRCHYSLVSIGTETTILWQRYDPDTHFARMFSFPQLQTGVQSIGAVEAVAGEVDEFKPGDLVYMRMGHGSHQVVPASECSPVPAGLDLKSACWCGLAKTAFRAAWAGGFAAGQHVLIIGAGPVGQMLTRWAAALGCDSVAVADISAQRLEFAEAGGATQLLCGDITELLPRIVKINHDLGPPVVIDSTGNAAVFQPALAAAARFGKVILLGDSGYPSRQCLSSDMMMKGLSLQATHDSHDRDGWTERRIDELFFATLADDRFPLAGMISHEFAPQQCAQAYTLAEQQRHSAMGILFDWSTEDFADDVDTR